MTADRAMPPDVGDALAQMEQSLSELGEGSGGVAVAAAPAEPDVGEVLTEGEAGPLTSLDQLEPSEQELLREIVDEEARKILAPELLRLEARSRENAILALADRYPELREPHVLGPVSAKVNELAERFGQPALRTDPQVIEEVFAAVAGGRLGPPAGSLTEALGVSREQSPRPEAEA